MNEQVKNEEPGIAVLPPVEPGALSQIVRAEVDMQVSTAKAYPRSIAKAKADMQDLACLSKEVAESCFYAYNRAGKLIEGPSIRLAEIALSSWGNTRSEARVIEEGKRYVTAQATTWDMEKNVLVRIESKRRIVDKNGNRYSDDMVIVTSNAAISIALRNSVFRVIPKAIIDDIYIKARKVAFGDAKAIALSRGVALETFGKLGVDQDRIFFALGVQSIEDIGVEELTKLRGALNAIRDGTIKIEEAFPPVPVAGKPGEPTPASRTASVMDKLKQKSDQAPAEPEQKPEQKSETASPPAAPPAPPAPPAAETQPAGAGEQTSLPTGEEQKPDKPKKSTRGAKKKERLIEIEAKAAAANIPADELAKWKEEIEIRDGQLRSQSAKRLNALQARVDAWTAANQQPEPEAPAAPAAEDDKRVVVRVDKKIIDRLLDRIQNLIGWEGDEARLWIERVLNEPLPTLEELTADRAVRLESILDQRETSLAEEAENEPEDAA